MFRRRSSRPESRDSRNRSVQPSAPRVRSAADAPADALAKLRRAARATTFESLETRTLLTTLFGSEIFEWQQSEETSIRVALIGNVTAEFIGASAGSLNQA